MAGFLSDKKIDVLFDEIKDVPGAVAEIGVNEGALFHRLIRHAQGQNKEICAFDSFRGMGKPDINHDDFVNYPKGKFDIGGVVEFIGILKKRYDIYENEYLAFDGFIPECFNKCDIDLFSFIYIDLDHYQPTKKTIEWALFKLNVNGILGFDDYFDANTNGISPLIEKFILSQKMNYRSIIIEKNIGVRSQHLT